MKKLKILLTSLVLVLSSCHSDESNINPKSISSQNEPALICTFDLRENSNNLTSKPNAAIIDSPHWETGQTIKIKFLDGTNSEHEIVKKYAAEWIKYANLKFEYVPKEQDSHIKIAINMGKPGAWSELGAIGMYPSPPFSNVQSTPTMRLGTIHESEGSRSTILHEFGHALGLVHETTNPAANIKWNLPKVYKYYYDLMGWSQEKVDASVINKANSTNYSEYDALSIMHYYIPSSLTTDGVAVYEQSTLSQIDKESINKWYPFPLVSVMECSQNFDDMRWKDRIQSSNGRYTLEFTPGFLRIIDLIEKKITWEVGNIDYKRKAFCYFESNGNITLRGSLNPLSPVQTIWSSNTSEYPGSTLNLKDDGDLQLIYNGVVKWSSKKGKV